jgi:hypothetical protein
MLSATRTGAATMVAAFVVSASAAQAFPVPGPERLPGRADGRHSPCAATFTDPDTDARPGDHDVTIRWDGSTSAGWVRREGAGFEVRGGPTGAPG